MEKDARLFNYQQTVICSCCDRGNLYCSLSCSTSARRESLKAVRRRYQNSRQGHLKNAERQRRYRQRKKQKVTDQGSPVPSADDLLSLELSKPAMHSMSAATHQFRCHFCQRSCSDFVRLGFMQGRTRVQSQRKTFWPLGS